MTKIQKQSTNSFQTRENWPHLAGVACDQTESQGGKVKRRLSNLKTTGVKNYLL